MHSRRMLPLLLFLLLCGNLVQAKDMVVGIAIAKNDHVYSWFADGKVTSGTSSDFDVYRHAYSYSLPLRKNPEDIIAISIAGSNDHVYAWYRDGYASSGTTDDLDSYRTLYKYRLPRGKTVANIVGIGIAKDDRVYTWYDDLTFSIGSTADLDKDSGPESYSLPPGKIATDIVDIDIAKSDGHVHVWYKDGMASSGTPKHLDSFSQSYGYIPAQVLYRWWGPGSPKLMSITEAKSDTVSEQDDQTAHVRHSDYGLDRPNGWKPQPEPDGDSPVGGAAQSPAYAARFLPGSNALDPMIAVGNQYLILSDTGRIDFRDKQGNLLPEKDGLPTSMSTKKFFEGFLTKTNGDGSFNERNINLFLGYSKPCDSPDYPQTINGHRFCIDEFYDTRVFFDPTSQRFFVMSNSRHQLWQDSKPGRCVHYKTAPKADTSDCVNETKLNEFCHIASDQYCDLPRRLVAFAVSKTEDPRDGFHQYMITENNYRDWPWMAVNGDAFVIAHHGHESIVGPVATVFSVSALKNGKQHPPYFKYYSKDVDDLGAVLPPTHYKNAAGLIFLLGSTGGNRISIFAFPQTNDPWTAPPLQKTSVDLDQNISVFNAVYRAGKLYLVGNKLVEDSAGSKRYSVRVVRIPVERPSLTSIKASTSASGGFLDRFFGRNTPSDPSGSRISYERSVVAVNKNGDMLFAYGRYPFSSPNLPKPEARYTVWYANETKQRPSYLLKAGEAGNSKPIVGEIDYTTAVVDPSDDKTFWMALPYASGGGAYRTVIGKVAP